MWIIAFLEHYNNFSYYHTHIRSARWNSKLFLFTKEIFKRTVSHKETFGFVAFFMHKIWQPSMQFVLNLFVREWGIQFVYYVHVLHICNIYKIHCMFLAFLKYYVYVYNIFYFCILRMYYAESAVDNLRIVNWFRRYYYFVKISFSYGIFPLKQIDIVKPIFLFYFSENIHNS